MSPIGSILNESFVFAFMTSCLLLVGFQSANSLSSDCPTGIEDTRIDWQGKNWAHSCQFADNNFLLEKTSNAKTCDEKCHLTPSCTHYSWSDWENGTCWLKNGSVHKCNARFNGANATQCGIVRVYDQTTQSSTIASINPELTVSTTEQSTMDHVSITNTTQIELHLVPAKEPIQKSIEDPFLIHNSMKSSSKKMLEAIQSTTISNPVITKKNNSSIDITILLQFTQSNQTINELYETINETHLNNINNNNMTKNEMIISQTSSGLLSNSLNSSSCSNLTNFKSNQSSVQITTATEKKLIYIAATTKNPFLHFWYEPLLRAKPHQSSKSSSSFILKNMEFINKHPFLLFVFGMTSVLFICLISIGVILLSNEHMPRQTSNLKKINCLTA